MITTLRIHFFQALLQTRTWHGGGDLGLGVPGLLLRDGVPRQRHLAAHRVLVQVGDGELDVQQQQPRHVADISSGCLIYPSPLFYFTLLQIILASFLLLTPCLLTSVLILQLRYFDIVVQQLRHLETSGIRTKEENKDLPWPL